MERSFERLHARESVRGQLFGEPTQQTVGRYVVRGVLGRGGLGVVFRAHDPLLDRDVAIKLLHDDQGNDPMARASLLREAQHLARVSSPNIVPVFDVGESDGHVFLAMELVQGQDLRRWLRTSKPTVAEIMRVFLEAAIGLSAVHAAGLVHRDFKPENVLLGSDGIARVADFGLARPLGVAPSSEGATIERSGGPTTLLAGTPAYMAPELFSGAAPSAASDGFAFAVALFEALYGQRPYARDDLTSTIEAAEQGLLAAVEHPDVPAAVHAALRRELSADPSARWPDVASFAAALRRASSSATRRRGAMLVVSGLTASLLLGWAGVRKPEEPCSVAARRFEDTYGAPRRAATAAAFGDRVVGRLDAYARSWREAAAGVCRGREDPSFDAQLACLDAQRTELEALLVELAPLDAAASSAALDASDELGDPMACLDRERRAAIEPARPADATEARLRWAMELGDYDGALAAADEVLRSIDTEDDRRLLAFSLWVRGLARVNTGLWDDGLEDIEAAHHLAVAEQDVDLSAQTADALAFNAANRSSDVRAARTWLRTAESWMSRGTTSLRPADLAVTAAAIDVAAGEASVALERLQHALAQETCSDCPAKLSVLEALAAVAHGNESAAYAQTRVDLVRARYGEGSTSAIEAAVALAGTQYVARRIDDAIATAEATRIAAQQLPGFDPVRLASLLDTLGKAHIAKGDLATAATRLEEANALLRDPANAGSQFAMVVRYDLARVYVHRNDPRAVDLLHEVVAAIEAEFGTEAPELAVVLGTLAATQATLGDRSAALATVRRAAAIAAAHPSLDPMQDANTFARQGDIALPIDPSEARRAAARGLERVPDDDRSLELRETLHWILARACDATDDPSCAATASSEAQQIALAQDSPRLASIRAWRTARGWPP